MISNESFYLNSDIRITVVSQSKYISVHCLSHERSKLQDIIMKSIIFAGIFLSVTLTSAERVRRALNLKEIDVLQQLKFPQDPKCGIYDDSVNYDKPDEFDRLNLPWMVSVTRKNKPKHLCDGVLIYPDVVIISAYCLENDMNEQLIVTANTMELIPRRFYFDEYKREVSKIHVNPTYEPCSRHQALAILILSKPFVLDDYIRVACLPLLSETYYLGNCVQKFMEDKSTLDYKWDHNDCGDRVFIAPNSSYSMGEASCEQGNETTAFIKQTHSYSLSCKFPNAPGKFYYLGSMVIVAMCGPDNPQYRFYDTLYKFMPWMYGVLKNRFIYYEPDERPIWN